jgi:hypothetical protein
MGKTSKSTQTVSIPPEVLARYNAVNARAAAAAATPFQRYTGEFVAPLTGTQRSGMANINSAANMAQSYYGNATNQLMNAQGSATPYYQTATNQLSQGVNAGNQYAGQSSNTLNAAYGEGAGIQRNALNNLDTAYASAQPYNQVAGSLYEQGLQQGSGVTGRALAGTQQALAGAQPYQGMATNYMTSGAQAVNPNELGADQINRYMSPYLQNVLQGTAGLLNQQNQQAQAGQMGNAIRSGAFGGDRGGIAAANLNQQQNLANAQIFSGLLNQGFNQALGTAQQQQQLNLGASQANRAAQQQAAQQALAIGQQGFGQGLAAAQQQGALGQQLFNMNASTGQNAAALGQQVYGQGTNTAQQQSAMGNTLFNQGATTAGQQAALGQQQFGQGIAASQQGAALGQGLYNMGANTSSQLAALGTGAQNAAIQGGQAQMNAGQTEQATQQALNTALLNQFKEEMSYPFQTAQFESNIAQGTGALSGSTTTTTQPGGFFSDARLKENIEKVGKTYDGQHIYRYNYKGDPTTQIGLIAQEVERHHPDAVGSNHHYRTVDYDKATDKAADRGHFYAGGLASMGGSVAPAQEGQGFADGGLAGVDPNYMAELYRQLHAISAGRGINGMQGIPTTPAEARELITARGLQERQGNDAADAVNAIESIGQLGDTVGAWNYGDKDSGREANAFGGEVEDPEAKKREEEAGLARAALEANKPEPAPAPAPTGLAAPASSPINPITPVKIEAPKEEIKFGEKVAPQKLAVASASVKPTNSGSETINDIGKLVQIGTSIAGAMNQGGRIYRDLGGAIPYSSGDSIVPQQDSAKPQLMTAQGTGAGGGGAGKAVGQMAGLASSLLPEGGSVKKGLGIVGKIFSDERMKENIRPIGELFDGQKVHSFNYKGDPRTQIGLIAQEVEHHRPHAVDHDHGMKTVDYHDATQHAVRRGHFAEGGMPEEEMVAPGLTAIHRKLNPLGVKTANLTDQLAQDNYSDLWNLDDENQGLGAADASPPPAENMLRQEPAAPNEGAPEEITAKAGAPKARDPKQPSKPGLTAPINNAPLPTGIAQIARLIHAGEGTGKNPLSSARGPYQFVDGTFVDQFRKNYPDRAKGMSKSQIISLKHGPEGAKISSEMGPRFIADNAKIIQRGGHTPDAGNVYLAHFLGADTAVKVLNANPSAPISRYVSQDAIDANPPLQKNPTVGGTINWARGYMKKQADYLDRKQRASGGLAGRDGYQTAGAVAQKYSPSQQEQIDFEEKQRKAAEQAAADELAAKTPTQDVIPAPGTSASNRFPVAEKTKAPGLTMPVTTATADGRGTNVAGVPSIAPGLVGTNPNLQATNGAIDSASNVAGTQDATQKTPGLLPTATPEQVAQFANGKSVAAPVDPKRANVFQRVLGYDKSKPYDPKTNRKFFQRLGHGETDAVLAALKGLAAMGTARTENLGVALAAGIGEGAEAFQGQRAFELEGRKTAAQEMQARATEQQAASGAIEAKAAWQNAMTQGATALKGWIDFAYGKIQGLDALGKKDPELNRLYDQALEKMKQFNLVGEVPNTGTNAPGASPTAPAAGAATPSPDGASAAAPAAAPSPTEPKGPVTMGGSIADYYNADEPTLRKQIVALQMAGMTEQAATLKDYADKKFPPEALGAEALEAAEVGAKDLTDLGQQARINNNALVTLKEFESALDRLPAGFQGPFSDQIVKYGSSLNQIATVFGIPAFFDPNKLASAEEAQKQANRLRDALVSGFRGTAGSEVMEKFVGSSPSLLNTEQGARRLISGVRQANKAVDAEYKFGVDYKGNPRERGIAFRKRFPPQYWVDRSHADFYFSNNKKLAGQIKADPSLKFKIGNQTARQYFDTHYRSIGGANGVLNLIKDM